MPWTIKPARFGYELLQRVRQGEVEAARQLLPGPAVLSLVGGAGHDLSSGKFDLDEVLLTRISALMNRDVR